jgi:hypothetical protein
MGEIQASDYQLITRDYLMCGGIAFKISKIPKKELERFYSKFEIEKFEKSGEVESFFWSKKPVLPVEINHKVSLFDWGNRDKAVPLPQTGWAKDESLDSGKWDYLNPINAKIPVEKGYEKGVWFEPKGDFAAVLVEKDNKSAAYMVTKPASEGYKKLTGHDREPVKI